MVLRQQAGYTKYPCFICQWDSRARELHWTKKKWPLRESLRPGLQNVVEQPLIDRNKVLLPPLHIKLGLMTNNLLKLLTKKANA